jgi:hypothetical protein
MANGLAQLIAQPQIANIAGGQRQFETQQQQNLLFAQQQAEQGRVGRARGLAGAALGGIPGIDQGLAQADPSLALKVFEATGVAGEARQAQFTEDVRIAAGLAQNNPQAAFESVQRAIDRNEAAGIPSPEMRQFLVEFAADPVTGAQNLQQLNTVLSPQEAGAGFTLGQGQQRFDAQGQPIASVAAKPSTPLVSVNVAGDTPVPQVVTPPELIAGLSDDVGARASAAFIAAGGGRDGVKALEAAIKNERKRLSDETKKAASAVAKQQQAGIVSLDIDRALFQATESLTTGFTGSIASAVPGTAAFDLKNTLNGIKANVGFGKLQQMRENSPTGGALGSVSENENRLLQSVLGSVEQSQSQEQLTRNLSRLKVIFDAVVNGTVAIPFTQAQFDSLPSGASYISPDTGTLHRKP